MKTCQKALHNHVISSRGAIVVLVWSALIHQLADYNAGYFILGAYATPDLLLSLLFALPLAQCVGLLLSPISGVIGDTWNRLQLMFIGLVIQTVATVIVTGLVFSMHFVTELRELWYVWAPLILSFGLIRVSLASFELNAIQMGSIQMPEAPSDMLSAYVHWLFLTIISGRGVSHLLLLLLSVSLDFSTSLQYTALYACAAQIVFLIAAFVLVAVHWKTLSLTLKKRNPVKLICSVLLDVLKNKYPRRRSAFTYSENPTRMDLAKSRYGGPFTTEEVEDVKSFLRINVVLLSLLGFLLTDQTTGTSTSIRALTNSEQADQYGFDFLTIQVFGVSAFTIIIGIPVYQLLIKPFCLPTYRLTMFKRMFLGLVLGFITLCFQQILDGLLAYSAQQQFDVDACSFYMNNTTIETQLSPLIFPYQLIMIPQILVGLGILLVFMTTFEFILAQSPYDMQGLLIGIAISETSLTLIVAVVEPLFGCYIWRLGLRAIFALLFLILFVITAKNYRRREREEPTEHNNQQVVEDVFYRYMQQETEFDTVNYIGLEISES